jgi:hypothetical protein
MASATSRVEAKLFPHDERRQIAKEALDQVHPQRRGRRVMPVEPGIPPQPPGAKVSRSLDKSARSLYRLSFTG